VRELPSRVAVRSLFWILVLLAWGCLGYLMHGGLAAGRVRYPISEEVRAKLLTCSVLLVLVSAAQRQLVLCACTRVVDVEESAVLAFLNRLSGLPRWTSTLGAAAMILLIAAEPGSVDSERGAPGRRGGGLCRRSRRSRAGRPGISPRLGRRHSFPRGPAAEKIAIDLSGDLKRALIHVTGLNLGLVLLRASLQHGPARNIGRVATKGGRVPCN
jgi:hypothetical protein